MKKHNTYYPIASLLFLLSMAGIISCSETKEKKKSEEAIVEKPLEQVDSSTLVPLTVPEFNEDSAYQYIVEQLKFGPRVPNTEAHYNCGLYFSKFFQQKEIWVYTQNFTATAYDGTTLKLRNFIASYNFHAPKRIIIASHWDSRPLADQDKHNKNKPIPGANDGASGVAVMMEIARAIHAHKDKPNVGIDFILFDGEDYGAPENYKGGDRSDSWCLGSKHWAKNKHRAGYSAYYGILLDMVGGRNARFAWDGTSRLYAPSILKKVWEQAHELGYKDYFVMENSPEIIDDHLYVNQLGNIPMIDIIQYDPSHGSYFADYWHTHRDDITAIDKKTLKAVGQTLLHVLYNEKP